MTSGSPLLSVRLDRNTRQSFRSALAGGSLRAAIIPVASTEQHNEHLAMSHDADIVMWIATQAAERRFPAVVVTPVLPVGVSEHWMDHPGTLTLTPRTFTEVVYEVCDSLRRAGLSRILIVNGHGGNQRPLTARLDEFNRRLGIRVDFCSYWDAYSPEIVRTYLASGEAPGHAGEFETATAMAIFPDSVHLREEAYPDGEVHIANPKLAKDDRRYFATARQATPEKGRVLLEIAVAWVARRLDLLLRVPRKNPRTSLVTTRTRL